MGGCQLLDLGQKPVIWQDFSRKLHENKKKLDQVGHVPSVPPPLDLKMRMISFYFNLNINVLANIW